MAQRTNEQRRRLLRQIHQVFSTNPRLSRSQSTIWIERQKIENLLADHVSSGTKHICIDGPSGSGKTSLARSVLTEIGETYAYVQVTNEMDWAGLCSEVIGPQPQKRGLRISEVKLELRGLLPVIGGTVDIDSAEESLPRDRSFTENWSIQSLAYLLQENNAILVIDDLEKAKPDLLYNIADIMKVCTSTYERQVITIGTGDVFYRVYCCDTSLSGRFEQVSVGSINNKSQAWELLYKGFNKLRFENPTTLARRVDANTQVREASTAAYLAADGLPKLINELGSKICENALGARNLAEPRRRISRADIINSCNDVVQSNIRVIRRKFPKIIETLQRSHQTHILLQKLYAQGVNQIHYWSDLQAMVRDELNEDDFQFAMESLIEAGLFIKTGRDSEVVFAEDPVLAHVFGVVSLDPKKYRLGDVFGSVDQFSLPLVQNEGGAN